MDHPHYREHPLIIQQIEWELNSSQLFLLGVSARFSFSLTITIYSFIFLFLDLKDKMQVVTPQPEEKYINVNQINLDNG